MQGRCPHSNLLRTILIPKCANQSARLAIVRIGEATYGA